MSARLELSDTHVFTASTGAMDDMLFRIGETVGSAAPELSAWLKDVAGRPAPFQDFDIRGLSGPHQAAFWKAVEHLAERRSGDGELHRLLELKAVANSGIRESLTGDCVINLTEIWDLRERRVFVLPSRENIRERLLDLGAGRAGVEEAARWARERLPPTVDPEVVDLRMNDEFAVRYLRLLAAADTLLGSAVEAVQWQDWAEELTAGSL